MARPRLVSISISAPSVRSSEVRAGTAGPIGRDLTGAPIGGLPPPDLAMPCPCAALAKTVRLTIRNHDALTPIYYGKFPLPPATAATSLFCNSERICQSPLGPRNLRLETGLEIRLRIRIDYGAEPGRCSFLDLIGSRVRGSLVRCRKGL